MHRILNYIPLAKAMPERNKRDGKDYVCTLGYDSDAGFIRVYPAPFRGIEQWTPMRFKAVKNKRDPRPASWSLPEDARHGEWSVNKNKVQYGRRLTSAAQLSIIRKMMANTVDAISQLNDRRESIGFLLVDSYRVIPDKNDHYINTAQIGMFDDVELADFTKYTKHSRTTMFRVRFSDADGVHNLQFNRWDIYETARKFGAGRAVELFSKPGPHVLMLGNYLQHQTSWSVLGIWSVPTQIELF